MAPVPSKCRKCGATIWWRDKFVPGKEKYEPPYNDRDLTTFHSSICHGVAPRRTEKKTETTTEAVKELLKGEDLVDLGETPPFDPDPVMSSLEKRVAHLEVEVANLQGFLKIVERKLGAYIEEMTTELQKDRKGSGVLPDHGVRRPAVTTTKS